MLMTGDLSEGHEILSADCGKCHTPFKNDFKTCSDCHQDIKKISIHSKGAIKCIYCHIGHDTKSLELPSDDPMTCLSIKCHAKVSKISGHSADPKICFNCHPEHLFEKRAADIKVSDLVFSHRLHTDGSNPKAYTPCNYCHQMSSTGINLDTPKALVQCKKCHSEWVGKHDLKKSIKEGECVKCHYAQKREIKWLGKKSLLLHARFSHKTHFNIECATCHFQMEIFDELEDISIFSNKKKQYFCARCHFNPFFAKN